ncbi:MAG: GNAT family N-acetyltransferase [Defluviitaleaceae bacterium]|nr:GNAT family N-acetyltransferase [Defluviitaleaceae bacterium]MCL2837279.1 GNAT family N-acetyltransferase [Defluviitaleaceae bacterium]
MFDKNKLGSHIHKLPAGYEIVPIDECVFHELPKHDWAEYHCSQFATFDEFQRYGLGYVVKFGDELICAASPYAYSDGMIDVQIDTVPAHQRKGIATACSASLILSCMDRGILPYWSADCDESRHLAEKLGYQLEKEFICYGIKS